MVGCNIQKYLYLLLNGTIAVSAMGFEGGILGQTTEGVSLWQAVKTVNIQGNYRRGFL